jgi:rhamnosyltransferase
MTTIMPDNGAQAAEGGGITAGSVEMALAIITVTFNPDVSVLARQLAELPADARKVVVDNASRVELRQEIRQLLVDRADILFLQNDANVGLAAALNQGARAALRCAPEVRYLLLLDQDSEPGPGEVERLLGAFVHLAAEHPKLGGVGPRLLDVDTGLQHGFHQISGWRWIRRYPAEGVSEPVPVAGLNGSGTLMPAAVFAELGGMDESLFIDCVDTEWSFRVLASGYSLYGIPDVRFRHRMGISGMSFWFFGRHVWPYRSPGRHYYLFRNVVRLLRMRHVPPVWKFLAPLKLMATLTVHLLFDRARSAQISQMLRGLRDGIRSGPT